MIFFNKAWESDISSTYAAGTILGYISLIFFPIPQLFSCTTPTAVLTYTCAAGVVFLIFSCSLLTLDNQEIPLQKKIGIALPDRKIFKEAVYLLCGLLPAIWLITWHWKFTLKKLEIPFADKQNILQLIDISKPLELFLLILMAVIIIPAVEELIYRRIIFGELSKISGVNLAGFAASGIFSAAHAYLAGVPGLFLAGLTFQWFYSKKQNLAASILLHALFNAVSIIFIVISQLYES